MSEDDHRRKRDKNNESVRKCRENEKKKIEEGQKELDKMKKENKELEEKYSNLQKELQLLKSLFQNSSRADCSVSIDSSSNPTTSQTANNAPNLNDQDQEDHTLLKDLLNSSNSPQQPPPSF